MLLSSADSLPTAFASLDGAANEQQLRKFFHATKNTSNQALASNNVKMLGFLALTLLGIQGSAKEWP